MKDELLIKFLLNESNSEENDEVENWLSLSDENTLYFLQIQKIWVESKNLSIKSEVDVEAAWLKFKDITTVKPTVLNTWMRIAAVFALIIGSWLLYITYNTASYTTVNTNAKVLLQTLPDGSELTLNKFSHVKYANNFKSNRSISLDSGDVFFNVTKDKNKPFLIEINKVTVQVVGTSFNIKHLMQQTEVVVETGTVKVSLGASEVLLHKGEKVIITDKAVKLDKTMVKDQLYAYYRTNLFVANNTPLPVLTAILNEAYGSKILIDDSAKNLTISTTLQYNKSLDQNLRLILETLDKLKIKRNQNGIILSY